MATPADIEILGGRRPIDLLAAGAFDEVLDAIERMNAGAM